MISHHAFLKKIPFFEFSSGLIQSIKSYLALRKILQDRQKTKSGTFKERKPDIDNMIQLFIANYSAIHEDM